MAVTYSILEITLHILSFLHDLWDISAVGATCSKLHEICKDDALFKRFTITEQNYLLVRHAIIFILYLLQLIAC